MSRRSTRGIAMDGIGMPLSQGQSLSSVPNSLVANSGYYTPHHYNHPAVSKLVIGPNSSSSSGKSHSGVGATPKAPKPPEKPLMPYMRYSRKIWEEVKANNPDLKLWEIGKIIGQMWRELPVSDKQQFIEEYEVEKIEYMDLMKSYQNSPAYQSYLYAKSRAEALEASADSMGNEKDDAYMSIEPVDESLDDHDAGFSVKHVAAARFQRNHRLINDILGEAIHVPNMRAVITTHRLKVLKTQVNSLHLHQKKLEAELKHIEENHTAKKRAWLDSSWQHLQEMKRLRQLSPQEYYAEWKKKQQQNAPVQPTPSTEKKEEKKGEEKNEENPAEPGKNEPEKKKQESTETTVTTEEKKEEEESKEGDMEEGDAMAATEKEDEKMDAEDSVESSSKPEETEPEKIEEEEDKKEDKTPVKSEQLPPENIPAETAKPESEMEENAEEKKEITKDKVKEEEPKEEKTEKKSEES